MTDRTEGDARTANAWNALVAEEARETLLSEAREMGRTHGEMTADMLTPADIRRLAEDDTLAGYGGPLSGEWAGDPTSADVLEALGIDADRLSPTGREETSGLLDAYEDGYWAAIYAAAERGLRYSSGKGDDDVLLNEQPEELGAGLLPGLADALAFIAAEDGAAAAIVGAALDTRHPAPDLEATFGYDAGRDEDDDDPGEEPISPCGRFRIEDEDGVRCDRCGGLAVNHIDRTPTDDDDEDEHEPEPVPTDRNQAPTPMGAVARLVAEMHRLVAVVHADQGAVGKA